MIFFVDFICSEPSPRMREAMFQRVLVDIDLSWLNYCVHAGHRFVHAPTHRSTAKIKRQDLFREIGLLNIYIQCNCVHVHIYIYICDIGLYTKDRHGGKYKKTCRISSEKR